MNRFGATLTAAHATLRAAYREIDDTGIASIDTALDFADQGGDLRHLAHTESMAEIGLRVEVIHPRIPRKPH